MSSSRFPSLADFSAEELVFMADDHDDKAFGILIENHPAMKATLDFFEFLSGENHPYGNMMFGMNVPDPERTIASVTEHLDGTKMPSYWWVGPCTKPENLSALLLEKGWTDAGTAPCLVVDLEKLERPDIQGLELHEVTTAEQLSKWQELFARAYEIPIEIARVLSPVLDGRVRLYTAILDGVEVGTTGLFTHLDVPGIYCVSTLREYRGRGIGAAITAIPLLEAREKGYQVGTLQASSMGYPVYKRIGFQDVCSLRIFSYNIP